MATKADVAEVRADMATKQDVAHLNIRIDGLNSRIDRMFWAMLGIGAGLIAAVLAGDFLA